MKSLPITLILLIILCASGYAQIQIGLKAGANFSNINNPDPIQGFEAKSATTTHWHAGLAMQMPVKEQFLFSSGLLYTIKGFEEASDLNTPNNVKRTLNLGYLALPLMLYYHPNEKISLGGGMELGYLLNAKTKIEDEVLDVGFLYDKKFEWSLNLGFRFHITPALFLDGQYSWGLSSISDLIFTDANGAPIGEFSLKNRSLQVSLGYFIIP